MKIYNSLTRRKEEFTPLEEGKVKMYACGITVSGEAHIGHAYQAIVYDMFRKFLQKQGYEVTYARNYTDVDDKIIARSKETGIPADEYAAKMIENINAVMRRAEIDEPDLWLKATENIGNIISFIEELVRKGHAYPAENGDVYFDVDSCPSYGQLSGRSADESLDGVRVENDEAKKNAYDFALWKAAKQGEISWDSPWGKGRPGWHIECSAMNRKYLGKTIDIHCGGQDLVFPHHENEIAQSECANDCTFSKYWMHNGYINVDNVKMSKSLGNFKTVREIADVYGYEVIRYFLISSHYRSPINYNLEIIEQCKSALERLYTCRESLDFAIKNAAHIDDDVDLINALNGRREQFIEAMDDDLNTADGLSAVFELVKDINTKILDKAVSENVCKTAAKVFDELCGVLGILYNRKSNDLDAEIEALIEKRQEARKNRDFATADKIRDDLKAQGIILKDTPQGVTWTKE